MQKEKKVLSGKEEQALLNEFLDLDGDDVKQGYFSVYESILYHAIEYREMMKDQGDNPNPETKMLFQEVARIIYCMQCVMKDLIDEHNERELRENGGNQQA